MTAGIEQAVREVMNSALKKILVDQSPLTIIDSPPGAGKTWFCQQLIALAGREQLRVCYVAPKVEQGIDMARRLVAAGARLGVDLLVGHGRTRPADLPRTVSWSSDATAVGLRGELVISNPQKLAASRDDLPTNRFDLLVVDEAYQVAARDFLPIADLAPCVAMVGDPGQLPPTITIDTAEFESDGSRMHWPAPKEILRTHPATPVFQLPASRRLVSDTVALVQPTFYGQLKFVSAADSAERRLQFAAAGLRNPVDAALDALAGGQTIVCITLPGAPPPADERDPEVERVSADVVRRVLERGGAWEGRGTLGQSEIGVIDSHVFSGQGTRAALQHQGTDAVRVATPELWQGQEAPLMIVKHPLSVGRSAPGAFDLHPGRFCVMLSRHLLGCVVVARESVGDSIEGYLHDSRQTPIGARDEGWAGYQSHAQVWESLKAKARVFAAR